MMPKMMRFIGVDVWRIRLKGLPPARALPLKYLRVFLAAGTRFGEHRCQLRASALTFFSLLSIVPVAAMAFGIAKGFYFEKKLQEELLEQFPGQEEVLLKVFGFANSMLESTKGGLIAGVGVIVLFWTIIKVLGNIEDSFNAIWGVQRPRTLARKATDYLSIMLTAPFLLVLSSSATVFLTTQVEFIANRLDLLGALRPVLAFTLKAAPFMIMWVLFGFVYVFIPNTKTQIASCAFAGIVAGTAYQAAQWFYVKFQVGVAHQNAIYGSFAALPLFLVWLQLSWIIVLAGAEIASAHQNADLLEFEPDSRRTSAAFKTLLSLRVVNLLSQNFLKGAGPLTVSDIADATDIPRVLLLQVLDDLSECGIVSVTSASPHRDAGYQPAVDTSKLTIKYVADALERRGGNDIPIARSRELDVLSESLRTFGECVEASPANKLLRDI
jgi:membrane protein